MSFHDIHEVLKPITDRYFDKNDQFDLESIYKEVFDFEDKQKNDVKEDIIEKIEAAQGMFQDAPTEDKEFFTMFALVVQLGFDVYVKRLLIEKLIDNYREKDEPMQAKSKKKEPKTE